MHTVIYVIFLHVCISAPGLSVYLSNIFCVEMVANLQNGGPICLAFYSNSCLHLFLFFASLRQRDGIGTLEYWPGAPCFEG
jgi:hypothetical protein